MIFSSSKTSRLRFHRCFSIFEFLGCPQQFLQRAGVPRFPQHDWWRFWLGCPTRKCFIILGGGNLFPKWYFDEATPKRRKQLWIFLRPGVTPVLGHGYLASTTVVDIQPIYTIRPFKKIHSKWLCTWMNLWINFLAHLPFGSLVNFIVEVCWYRGHTSRRSASNQIGKKRTKIMAVPVDTFLDIYSVDVCVGLISACLLSNLETWSEIRRMLVSHIYKAWCNGISHVMIWTQDCGSGD